MSRSDSETDNTGQPGPNQSEPARRLAKQYNVITIGGALTLLTLVTTLFFHQYLIQRDHQLEVLEDKLKDRKVALDSFLESTPFYIQQLRSSVQYYLTHGADTSVSLGMESLPQEYGEFFAIDKVTPPYTKADVGNFFGVGSFAERAQKGERLEFQAALNLFPLFKAAHERIPHFGWSYYQSQNNFTAIYPWVPTLELRGNDPDLSVAMLLEVSTSPAMSFDIFVTPCG